MRFKLQWLIPFLLSLAGAGVCQTASCEFFETYGDGRLYHPYGYPSEHRCTVRVIDYPPIEKPELLEPEKKPLGSDPLKNRLTRRMETITATNFVTTNAVPINIAPGLSPEN